MKRYSICSGSYTEGTWYSKKFATRFFAVIAAKKRSAEIEDKVYLHVWQNPEDYHCATDSIYRDGKRDYETEENCRKAEAYLASIAK